MASRAIVIAILACVASTTHGGVVWYLDDYDGWAAAAGEVHTIDFETLPDGSASIASTPITLDFNYTDQGVTFTGPVTTPFIAGNTTSGFGLRVDSSPNLDPNWIIADSVEPASAIGIHFSSFSRLSLFDAAGQLIDENMFGPDIGLNFLGAISSEAVFLATTDRNFTIQSITSFSFSPLVPELSSVTFICLGLRLIVARARSKSKH